MKSRQELVVEARSWIGTPYIRRAAIKGVGADCGSFLGAVMVACDILPAADFAQVMKEIEWLQDDWFLHKAEKIYVELMSRFIPKIRERMTYGLPGEEPGNIILMQTSNSRSRNHGGFVTRWPKAIHCVRGGVTEVDVLRDPLWEHTEISVYDPWRNE